MFWSLLHSIIVLKISRTQNNLICAKDVWALSVKAVFLIYHTGFMRQTVLLFSVCVLLLHIRLDRKSTKDWEISVVLTNKQAKQISRFLYKYCLSAFKIKQMRKVWN